MKKKAEIVKNQKAAVKSSAESRLMRFLGPYVKKLVAGVALLSVLAVGGVFWWSFQQWNADKAMNLFNTGTDGKSFSEVVRLYPHTKAAKLAWLKIIELEWNSQNYAEVEKGCQEFLKQYPEDLFTPFLRNLLGEAYLVEKKLNEAEALYTDFMKEGTGGYLFPLAQINLARVYMGRNETEKAKSFLSKMQNDPSFQFWNDNIEAMMRREK